MTRHATAILRALTTVSALVCALSLAVILLPRRPYRSIQFFGNTLNLTPTEMDYEHVATYYLPSGAVPASRLNLLLIGHDLSAVRFIGGMNISAPPKPIGANFDRWWLSFPRLAFVTAILPLYTLGRDLRRRRRLVAPTTLCPHCGYDCRATPTRCPECGHVPAPSTPAPGSPASGHPSP